MAKAEEASRDPEALQKIHDENQMLKDENLRLKVENSALHGKVRGYKTLGDLLHETKQELARHRERKERMDEGEDSGDNTPAGISQSPASTGLHQQQPLPATQPLDPSSAPDLLLGQEGAVGHAMPQGEQPLGQGGAVDHPDSQGDNHKSRELLEIQPGQTEQAQAASKPLDPPQPGISEDLQGYQIVPEESPDNEAVEAHPKVSRTSTKNAQDGKRAQKSAFVHKQGSSPADLGSQDQGKAAEIIPRANPSAEMTESTDPEGGSPEPKLLDNRYPSAHYQLSVSGARALRGDVVEDSDRFEEVDEGKMQYGGAAKQSGSPVSSNFALIGTSESAISYPSSDSSGSCVGLKAGLAGAPSPPQPGDTGGESLLTLSSEVAKVAALLQQAGGADEPLQIASQMAQLSIQVVKMNRQMQRKDVVIDQLNTELHQTKTKMADMNNSLQKENILLRQEKQLLLAKIQKVERERDHLSQSSSISGTFEFLDIERKNKTTPDKLPETVDLEECILVKASSEATDTEVALLNKIKKQEEEIKQLKSSTSSKEQALATSQQELDDYKERALEHNMREEMRMRDIDKMLLAAKKKCEAEQNESDTLRTELALEKQRGDNLSEMNRALQDQILGQKRQIQSMKSETNLLNKMQSAQVLRNPVAITAQRTLSAPSGDPDQNQDLKTKVDVLQQQVAIYKDDFDRERRDRERTQAEKDQLREQLEQLNVGVASAELQAQRLGQQLEREKEEKLQLQQTIMQLQRQAPPKYNINYNYQQQEPKHQMYAQPPPAMRQWIPPPQPPQAPAWSAGVKTANNMAFGGPKWACRMCTFDNPPQRSTCEACGFQKDQHQAGRSQRSGQGQGQVPLPVQQMQGAPGQQMRFLVPRGGVDEVDGAPISPPVRSGQTQFPQYLGVSQAFQSDVTIDSHGEYGDR